jgi:transcriptional regulator with XRE-family HTH domain
MRIESRGGELESEAGGLGSGGRGREFQSESEEGGPDSIWVAALLAAEARAKARLTPAELLGRGLLRLRLYIGWSQRDVERSSGVDQSTLCRLETGKAANVGSARICAILRALRVGDVVFLPRLPTVEPTALELMLRGDPWKRAVEEAERRVNRRRSA